MSRNLDMTCTSRFCPDAPGQPMTRCECHDVEFSEIVRFAHRSGIYTTQELIAQFGCCQTCTACECDLKNLLSKFRSRGPQELVLAGAAAAPGAAAPIASGAAGARARRRAA